MKKPLTILFAVASILLPVSFAFAQNSAINAPDSTGATTIYRQVMPDGQIVYSDTVTKGVKIDRILSVPGSGNRAASKTPPINQMRGAGNTTNTSGSGNTGR